ncbi:MAG: PilT/PilU family type 4a pilus ATPase [Deltaproteobacteria bacterium]|nr:PilT/PilU family type 4a pilus ATPase [Deltaproteobacteria bacterium]
MSHVSSAAPVAVADLDSLLRLMVSERSSDLFLCEGRSPALRIDGVVRVTMLPALEREELVAFLDRAARPSQRELFERNGDLDVGLSVAPFGRFRIHFHHQRGLLGAVVRAVPSGQLDFSALGLPDAARSLAECPRGLVLVTGSTGSGKSTTLAAMLHHINASQPRHIVTLEDPIEFVHEDLAGIVTQREVGSDTRDFASALRHVVRESPDVILIGEMRDAETMNVALSAALTGHLVLSSLHTIDASQTLQRILSYYPEHLRDQACMDLSLCLQGILSQRLGPRLDGSGRAAAVEVLLASPAVRKLIRDQRVDELSDFLSTAGEGMQSFNRALVSLYERKVITYDTGAAYATNPDEFRLNAQGMERSSQAFVAEHEALAAVGSLDMRSLLTLAMRYGASDVHLVVGSPPMFRIHGKLRRLEAEALSPTDARRLLYSLLSHAQREQFELEHELDFALTITGKHRFRVNAHLQRGTVAVALRLIPNSIPDGAGLGIPATVLELATRPQGLILVAGPTGAGKSTTLAAMIDRVNATRGCHIITVEDPIEFIHYNKSATVEQREVGADTKSFGAALKYILRQDPDVILVGELRDTETISAALTASETGHLVLATLHTNDAPQTIDRVVDVFPPHQQSQARVQLGAALLAVISQRLLLRADGSGRVAAFEVLVANSAVRSLVREGKTHQLMSAMETGFREGMITLDRSVTELIKAGVVSVEEGARYMRNPASLRALADG